MNPSKRNFLILIMLPALIYIIAVILYPIFSTFLLSFQKYNFINPPQNTEWVGINNYLSFLKDTLFWLSIKNTVIYVASAVGFELIFGLSIAFLLSKVLNNRNRIINSIILIPSLMAPIVVGLIFRYMFNTEFGFLSFIFNKIGLFVGVSILGSKTFALWAIIFADIWEWTPFIAIILYAGMITLPVEPYEAAKIDGASDFGILKNITIPLLIPIIRIVLLIRIADAIKEFDKIFIMTEGGPGAASETLNFYAYRMNFRYFDMGVGSAEVLVILLIITLVSLGLFKILKTQGEINEF